MYKILIVDDKEENLSLLQSVFNTEEFRTIFAKNGKEALDIARNEHPDFIISDVLMPVMDGFQLCRECKRDDNLNNIYFIFYTATYIDEEDEEFALSLGAQKYLRKPLEPEVLLEVIREAVNLPERGGKELFKKPEHPENEIYKLYSERLVSKLEDKNIDIETELLNLKEKTEKSDKLKTAFLANLLHEIRTPINAIVGFSALLGEPDVDSAKRHSYIDVIMNSSDHLLSIFTDVIDISNIEANIVKINKNGIILNSLIRTLYEQFLPKVREKGIELIQELALPDEDSIILADNTKLTQVISNLLGNALKFTHNGQIRFGYSVNDKLIGFFVADTGIGILPEYHKRVFDRFFQVENPASKFYGGTGLGLSICKAYVELLGGEISLSSTPGEGSTFYFTIPYEKPSARQIPVPPGKKENGFIFSKKKKILVAEDIESNFRLINYFLAKANIDIVRAWNGEEAVEKVTGDKKIDLILMDLKMPVMDGYTAVKLIRELRPDIPIIAQSAYVNDKTRVMECGCNGFISKPFDKQKLLSVIKEFI